MGISGSIKYPPCETKLPEAGLRQRTPEYWKSFNRKNWNEIEDWGLDRCPSEKEKDCSFRRPRFSSWHLHIWLQSHGIWKPFLISTGTRLLRFCLLLSTVMVIADSQDLELACSPCKPTPKLILIGEYRCQQPIAQQKKPKWGWGFDGFWERGLWRERRREKPVWKKKNMQEEMRVVMG